MKVTNVRQLKIAGDVDPYFRCDGPERGCDGIFISVRDGQRLKEMFLPKKRPKEDYLKYKNRIMMHYIKKP